MIASEPIRPQGLQRAPWLYRRESESPEREDCLGAHTLLLGVPSATVPCSSPVALPLSLYTYGFQMVRCWELDGFPNHKAQKVQTSLSIMTLETGQNLPGSPGLVELTLAPPQSLGFTPSLMLSSSLRAWLASLGEKEREAS